MNRQAMSNCEVLDDYPDCGLCEQLEGAELIITSEQMAELREWQED